MSLISRYEHLPNRPLSDEARPLLEKIASQVKPIMTKRGWKVGTLAEVRACFCCTSPLGLAGPAVCVAWPAIDELVGRGNEADGHS